VLPGPEGSEEPPEEATRHEAVFSLVVQPPGARFRKLPTLYVRSAPVFADKELAPVLESLQRNIEVVRSARERPTYALRACRLDGETGLYGADVYNRSPIRGRLARLGMDFSHDPYVELGPDGRLRAQDWGELDPRFFIIGVGTAEGSEVVEMSGAMALALMSNSRFGELTARELRALASLFSSVRGVGCRDARALIAHLRATR
jgi:hypothetical protein